jgi:hypothetical protein
VTYFESSFSAQQTIALRNKYLIQGEIMKFSYILMLLMMPLLLKAQGYYGYGLQGGLQGCGYNVSMGSEAQSYLDDIDAIKKQISADQREKSKKQEQLRKVQADLRKYDTKLRNSFSSESYSFIKNHMDNYYRCQDYKGFYSPPADEETATTPATSARVETKPDGVDAVTADAIAKAATKAPPEELEQEPAPQKQQARPAQPRGNPTPPPPATTPRVRNPRGGEKGSFDVFTKDVSRLPASAESDTSKPLNLKIDSKKLKKEWSEVCDLENNPKAQLRAEICSKTYLWI